MPADCTRVRQARGKVHVYAFYTHGYTHVHTRRNILICLFFYTCPCICYAHVHTREHAHPRTCLYAYSYPLAYAYVCCARLCMDMSLCACQYVHPPPTPYTCAESTPIPGSLAVGSSRAWYDIAGMLGRSRSLNLVLLQILCPCYPCTTGCGWRFVLDRCRDRTDMCHKSNADPSRLCLYHA